MRLSTGDQCSGVAAGWILWLIAAVVGAGLGPRSAEAQASPTEAIVHGFVRGVGDGPLEGVWVEIVQLKKGVLTDASGRFRIGPIPLGQYTVRFSLIGRRTNEIRLRVARASVAVPMVTLSLDAIPVSPLSIIEQRTRLTYKPIDLPGSAQVLGPEELESTVSSYDDIHQFLRQVPGVNVQEEDGFGLRPNIGMRGSGSERSSKITVMEDGILIAPAPYAAPAAYYFPVAGRMSAIEVRKGSSQIRFGPRTIGGALNLVSSPIPSGFEWNGEAALGGNATRRFRGQVGGSSSRFGWLAETYQIATDGFKRLASGASTGFVVRDYLAKLRWNSDPNSDGLYQQLDLKLGFFNERSDETYLGLTEDDVRANPLLRYPGSQQDLMEADQRQVQARYFLRLSEAVDLTTTLYRHDFARNWYKLQSVNGVGIADVLAAPGNFPEEMALLRGLGDPTGDLRLRANNREYYAQGIQSAVGTRVSVLGLHHDLEFGLRYHRDQEDRFQHEDGYTMTAGTMVLADRGAPGSQSNQVSDASAWALYVQDRIDLGRMTLTPGLRYETVEFTRTDFSKDDPSRSAPTRVRTSGVTAALPGLGATYRLGSDVHLFGGLHRGFGPPGPGADDRTEAEHSVNYEIGTRFERGGMAAEVTGFYNDYGNTLGVATLSSGTEGSGEFFNGGAAGIWGLEASAAYDLAPGAGELRFPFRAVYTLTSARFETSFESEFDAWGTVAAGDEMPYVPRHLVFGSLGVSTSAWRVSFTASYTSRMRTVAGQGPVPGGSGTDPHLVLTIGGEYRLPGTGRLFVGLQNLTDRRYVVARRPAGARPGLPRLFEAGVRFGG